MSAPAVSDADLFPEASLYFTAFFIYLFRYSLYRISVVTHRQSCLGLPILSVGNIIGSILGVENDDWKNYGKKDAITGKVVSRALTVFINCRLKRIV